MPFLSNFFKSCFIVVVCGSEHVEGRGSELNSDQVRILYDRVVENLKHKLEEQSERDREQSYSK